MIGIIISFVITFIGFLISPVGFFAFGLGLALFFGLPLLPRVTGVGQSVSNFYQNLASQSISRAAVVVSEHNDIYFKPMRFVGRGVEVINFDGKEKEFEDPDSALHYWLGIPFALADEKKGVLFDPRHAALGQRKFDARQRGEDIYNATTEEWNSYEVTKWVRGVFEMPTDYEIVNLSKVRELVDGGERAEYPEATEEMYKHSRSPYNNGMSMLRMLSPVIAFMMTFGGIWIISSQGGSEQADTTISFGSALIAFLLVSGAGVDPRSVNWRRVLAYIVVLTPLPLLFVVLWVVAGPLFAIMTFVALVMGFWLIPIFSVLCRPSAMLSGVFSRLFFRLGFMSYDRAVFEWTPSKYVVREASELETTEDVTWYSLFGSLVGFTYTPGEESWGPEVTDHTELEDRKVVADGGGAISTNLPRKYSRTEGMRCDDYGLFVPNRLDYDSYYLNTSIATARFENSAVGDKSLRRLLEAKEKFGEDDGMMSDSSLVKLNALSGLLGAAAGVFIFLL